MLEKVRSLLKREKLKAAKKVTIKLLKKETINER